MAKNVQRFIQELADYINRFIVGTENTVITGCVVTDRKMNRGHAIPIQVKNPDGAEGVASMGPCYYAEELIAENEGSTVAAIAEKLNVEVNVFYEDMIKLMEAQKEAQNRTVTDYGTKDIILTAVPAKDIGASLDGPFVKKEVLGLMAVLKGEIMSSDTGTGIQAYYSPVLEDLSHEVTEEEWEKAKLNSLARAELGLMAVPVEDEDGSSMFVCGEVVDVNEFFDYFYLLAAKPVWELLMKDLKAERIYMFPQGAYNVKFVCYGGRLEGNDNAKALRSAFMESAIRTMGGLQDVYVVDNETLEIRKMEEKR